MFQIAGASDLAGFKLHPVYGPSPIHRAAIVSPHLITPESVFLALRSSHIAQSMNISTAVAIISPRSPWITGIFPWRSVMQNVSAGDVDEARRRSDGVTTFYLNYYYYQMRKKVFIFNLKMIKLP